MTKKKLTIKAIDRWIKTSVPEFKEAIDVAVKKKGRVVCHQDLFARDLDQSEMFLLGCLAKLCGHYGVEFAIVGKNGESIGDTEEETMENQERLVEEYSGKDITQAWQVNTEPKDN